MTTAATFWDKIAANYAKSPVRDVAAYETTLERVRSYLKPEDEILEVGCGTGTTALKLAPCVAHIHASDVSANMIEIARGKANDQDVSNVAFSVADAGAGDAASYDAILAFNLLHLLEDAPKVIAHLKAQIKPGGYMISKTVCLGKHGWHWRILITLMRLIGKAPEVHFFSIDALEAMFKDAGFTILETGNYPASPPNHFIVAQKA